ncbi:hypothetical protein [Sphingomonas sp. HMP6]|uniref:hypothetical protein n=1 Tax=Sphingomonas sp. HMP6 TaxID=1517551 RepID=UPI001E4D2245|nr:hypothetical protein [Sphingomonas sp. HMP6]
MYEGRRAELLTIRQPRWAFHAVPSASASGLWECDLATEQLIWSDGVYDLFGLPRGVAIDRAATLAQYVPESRIAMECHRVAAIRDKTGFTVDAQIRVDGAVRWIRIAAHVECIDGAAVRLRGAKYDVTLERSLIAA